MLTEIMCCELKTLKFEKLNCKLNAILSYKTFKKQLQFKGYSIQKSKLRLTLKLIKNFHNFVLTIEFY